MDDYTGSILAVMLFFIPIFLIFGWWIIAGLTALYIIGVIYLPDRLPGGFW